MMEFLEQWNLVGLMVGLITFVIIGVFHPLVIYGEKRFTYRVWWVFLVAGVAVLAGSFAVRNTMVQAIMCVLAFTCFWAIKECFEQPQRREDKELLKKIKEEKK